MMKKHMVLIIFSSLIILLGILFFASSKLTTTYYNYESDRVPESFDGARIVQLSDIHCKRFGKDNEELIRTINAQDPDIILITGDCIDQNHHDLTPLEQLFAGIQDTAPIYAISGNHECDDPNLYGQLIALYNKYGITDLDDKEILWSKGGSSISIKGLGAFENKLNWDNDFMKRQDENVFSILLDHYPQLNRLAWYGYDIILSGHVHGGVIRLPYVGGLIGNNGDFFPEYDGGEYKIGDSTMYVSRGLGSTVIPRINNNPEVVVITLHRKD